MKRLFSEMRIILQQILLGKQGTTVVIAFNWLKYDLTSNQINTLLNTRIHLSSY